MSSLSNPEMENLISAELCIDCIDKTFSGYITGEKWNGFERALFTPDVMKQIYDYVKLIDPEDWQECWGIDDFESLKLKNGLYDFGFGYAWQVVNNESE